MNQGKRKLFDNEAAEKIRIPVYGERRLNWPRDYRGWSNFFEREP